LPEYVVSAGRAVSIPYNGAVARVLFGVGANSRVRSWINDGDFDLLHLHEPAIPSLSLLACWAGEGAMVGTFHAAAKYQKAIVAIGPILEPVIEKLSARIAVSESARLTLTAHLETDAIVIPNGITRITTVMAHRVLNGQETQSGSSVALKKTEKDYQYCLMRCR
jgi:phosphatidyl-myo-inositol alpha-mannosyltransferase